MANPARVPDENPWKEAILEAHILNFTWRKEFEDNPELALQSLIRTEIDMENDPAISEPAAKRQAQLSALELKLKAAEDALRDIGCLAMLPCRDHPEQRPCTRCAALNSIAPQQAEGAGE